MLALGIMDIHNLRQKVAGALEMSGMSQVAFAETHQLCYSTLNKFLRGHLSNPRLSTLNRYERVIQAARQSN